MLRQSLDEYQRWRERAATAHPAVQGGWSTENADRDLVAAAEPDQRWQVAMEVIGGRFGSAAAESIERAAAGLPYSDDPGDGMGFYPAGVAGRIVASLGFDADQVEAVLNGRLNDAGHIETDEMAAAVRELVSGDVSIHHDQWQEEGQDVPPSLTVGMPRVGKTLSPAQMEPTPCVQDPLNPTDEELQAAIQRGIERGDILTWDDFVARHDTSLVDADQDDVDQDEDGLVDGLGS